MKYYITILLSIFTQFFYSQNNNYSFVGRKISVKEVSISNTFYFKYENKYVIEQELTPEKINKDTISFYSYSHLRKYQYSMYDYALIFLVKNKEGQWQHRRTDFKPIILKQNGIWMGFELQENKTDDYININSSEIINIKKNIKILKTIYPEFKNNRKTIYKLLKIYFPERFFKYESKYKVTPIYLKPADKMLIQ